ncbi:MAG: hypothetical protein JWO04_5826 [Gammaproteobacteria bacterium]|nr:hypothetical protein [Gammaproteobacteria bacterium]
MARSHRPPTERPPVTAGSSRPSPAARVAPKLRKPLICRPFPRACASGGIAGVGTFPGWLSLAVAPASKGLIPQPVSMSGLQCMAGLEDASRRASSGRVPRGARGAAAYVMRGRPALAASGVAPPGSAPGPVPGSAPRPRAGVGARLARTSAAGVTRFPRRQSGLQRVGMSVAGDRTCG